MKKNPTGPWTLVLLATAILSLLPAASAQGVDIDEKPIPVKTPPPAYPETMAQQHQDGLVILKVSVSEKGEVESCEVKRSTHTDFEGPAVQAVQRWRFKPAKKAGTPVKTEILLPLRFNHEG